MRKWSFRNPIYLHIYIRKRTDERNENRKYFLIWGRKGIDGRWIYLSWRTWWSSFFDFFFPSSLNKFYRSRISRGIWKTNFIFIIMYTSLFGTCSEQLSKSNTYLTINTYINIEGDNFGMQMRWELCYIKLPVKHFITNLFYLLYWQWKLSWIYLVKIIFVFIYESEWTLMFLLLWWMWVGIINIWRCILRRFRRFSLGINRISIATWNKSKCFDKGSFCGRVTHSIHCMPLQWWLVAGSQFKASRGFQLKKTFC